MARTSRIVFVFAMLLPGWAGASATAGDDIHRLIRDGEIEKAKALLDKDPELIKLREAELDQTPLHIAAHRGHVELVRYLLEHGAEVNARAYNRFTPLCLTRDPAIVKLLIDYKADLEVVDASGWTVLQTHASTCGACQKEADLPERQIVKLLLEAGAKYDIKSAVCLGDLERVRVLLKKDPKQAREEDVLHFATRYNRLAVAKLLMENKVDFANAYWYDTPTIYFGLEYPDMVRLYLQAGFNPKVPLKYKERTGGYSGPPPPTTADKLTLLHIAAGGGYMETAKLLLEAGAPVNVRTADDKTPLYWAAGNGEADMVTLLLKHKTTVEGKDGTRAMAAAASAIRPAEDERQRKLNKRYREIINILRIHHVSFDLFPAIALGDTGRVKMLLKEKPALASTKEGDGPDDKSALQRAVALDREEIVALLLNAGASVNAKDDDGCTALHGAAFWGREEIAKLLIECKADVNATSPSRVTPLHEATRLNKLAVAKLLLAAGADVNAKDKEGRTPLSYTDNPELVKLLRERGGTK